MKHSSVCPLVVNFFLLLTLPAFASEIKVADQQIALQAGVLERVLDMNGGNLSTVNLTVEGHPVLAEAAGEVSLTFSLAVPNQCPQGFKPDQLPPIDSKAGFRAGTDVLEIGGNSQLEKEQTTKWQPVAGVSASRWSDIFDRTTHKIEKPAAGISRLTITAEATKHPLLKNVSIEVVYEVYDDFPAIRKWVRVINGGGNWLKIDRLMIDDLRLSDALKNRIPLTPGERGAASSVVACEAADRTYGLIAASEVPSAARVIESSGSMGYSTDYFEWVLGPGEKFESEPVFHYAYAGKIEKTISAESLPRDRAVEGPYLRFLLKQVGMAADTSPIRAPLWATWSNIGPAVDEANVREMARLAARCGFEVLSLDDGWQNDRLGTEVNEKKFPDFPATVKQIQAEGLKLGMWVSCYRSPGSKDLLAMPEARAVPLRTRMTGFGMSYACPWREYYAASLIELHKLYGAVYFKQDFTNLKLGDIAAGHESRTRKESILRTLRGLLAAQDIIRKAAPDVVMEITHEIYWGTPGVPCDVAVLKHANLYHIPPNDYSGAGNKDQRVSEHAKKSPAAYHRELLQGCLNARNRFYAHRGLPLQGIEYYGAATVNHGGSLTADVQDRQVCSWLMGAPQLYSGDLASLTEDNIGHYAKRFALLKELQSRYDIYRHFQFSGVPAPTDADWHWWGKLGADGCGAVVVLRGDGGDDRRAVNIPWVAAEKRYRLKARFAESDLGTFSGQQLREGAVVLALPKYGQEILELSPAEE
jgi:hypothetical protein